MIPAAARAFSRAGRGPDLIQIDAQGFDQLEQVSALMLLIQGRHEAVDRCQTNSGELPDALEAEAVLDAGFPELVLLLPLPPAEELVDVVEYMTTLKKAKKPVEK